MDDYLLAALGALWLGIITSISPCPLATNIAAISFIGKSVESSKRVLCSGLLYSLGRLLVYLVLGFLIMLGIVSNRHLSEFLQNDVNMVLGPVLILVGMFILGLLSVPMGGSGVLKRLGDRVSRLGLFGALLLGMVFALAFCPVSAAYFFGGLITISVKHSSTILFPSLYGIGTALPVIVFAFVIAFSVSSIGKAFHVVSKVSFVLRYATGVIFILVGIYYSLTYIWGVM